MLKYKKEGVEFMSSVVSWVVTLVWAVLFGYLCRKNVIEKGYQDQGTKWFILGFFFGIIAFIFAYIKKPKEQ